MITGSPGSYSAKSHSGKNLGGPYTSRAAAQKRLGQVEYFKHARATGTKRRLKRRKRIRHGS